MVGSVWMQHHHHQSHNHHILTNFEQLLYNVHTTSDWRKDWGHKDDVEICVQKGSGSHLFCSS